MDQQTENRSLRSERKSRERPEGGSYKDVAKTAVHKEGDVKADMGPSVSMTVVGEHVEFIQHFHF